MVNKITHRQTEVLELAALGCTRPEIGERLFIAPATVKRHFESIYRQTGTHNAANAVAWAIKHGYIKIEELEL